MRDDQGPAAGVEPEPLDSQSSARGQAVSLRIQPPRGVRPVGQVGFCFLGALRLLSGARVRLQSRAFPGPSRPGLPDGSCRRQTHPAPRSLQIPPCGLPSRQPAPV